MLCLGRKKSLSSPRLQLMAQGMAQCTDDQSRVWYHSAIQAPHERKGYWKIASFEALIKFENVEWKVFTNLVKARVMVVAQLAEQPLTIPEVCGSNLVLGNFIEHCIEKMNIYKRGRQWPIFINLVKAKVQNFETGFKGRKIVWLRWPSRCWPK